MPTPDRTTLKATMAEFVVKLRNALVSDPLTASQPFRSVVIGDARGDEHPRPFLALTLIRVRPIGAIDGDKMLEASMTLRMFTDVLDTDSHPALLDKIGAIEDHLDNIIDEGVIEGAAGFDDRVWSFDYPITSSGARLASASANQTFVVKVEREHNREPKN
jgi:hypothetical protein